jgi:hypothetical protein
LVPGVVTDEAGFDGLRDGWHDLLLRSADPNVFLTWDWLRIWWRHFGENRDGRRLHIVTVHSSGPDSPDSPDDPPGRRLVAVAPLFRDKVGPRQLGTVALRQISFDAGDYGGLLIDRRYPEAISCILRHLAGQLTDGPRPRPQTVTLSRLASDSALLSAIRNDGLVEQAGLEADPADLGDACPYADVREGYNLNRHLKKHKVRQRMRRLGEKYAVSFDRFSGDTLDEGLDVLLDLHRRRWEGSEDEFQGLLADGGQEAFLLDAVRALDGRGCLQLRSLKADERPVAVELDFEMAGRVYMFKGAFDPEFGEFSPGQLLHFHVFEEGIARGVEEFDFLRGDHPYKRRWANADRHLVTVTLSRPGRAGRLARERVRVTRGLASRLPG